jgi:membrane protease YdiL (CAAX protease family)
MERRKFILFCLVFYGLLSIVGYSLSRVFGDLSYFRIVVPSVNDIIFLVIVVVISTIISVALLKTKKGKRMVVEFKNMFPNMGIFERGIIAISSGMGEEIFFRGFLQPIIGIFITSILFGVVHIPPNKNMKMWPFFAIVVGFMLGCLLKYTGTIVIPIVAHALINFIGFIIIISLKKRKKNQNGNPS